MASKAISVFGRIDYLVNSAGIGVKEHQGVEEVDPETMDKFWKVNVLGTMHSMQVVAGIMKKQDVATFETRGSTREIGRGAILNVGSANSFMATPAVSPYVTTKHAVMGLTKSAGPCFPSHFHTCLSIVSTCIK